MDSGQENEKTDCRKECKQMRFGFDGDCPPKPMSAVAITAVLRFAFICLTPFICSHSTTSAKRKTLAEFCKPSKSRPASMMGQLRRDSGTMLQIRRHDGDGVTAVTSARLTI